MTNEIVAFAQAQAKTAARRAAVPAAFALVCGLFVRLSKLILDSGLSKDCRPRVSSGAEVKQTVRKLVEVDGRDD